jgi:hypothetical protein
MTARVLDSRSPVGSAAPGSRQRPGVLLTVWVLSFFCITVLYELELLPPGLPRLAAAAVNTVLGLVTLASYVGFLRRCDELERKIHVEALALGFGAGAVGMMGWRLFERAGAPRLDSNDGLLVMLVAYGVGVALARRRYA